MPCKWSPGPLQPGAEAQEQPAAYPAAQSTDDLFPTTPPRVTAKAPAQRSWRVRRATLSKPNHMKLLNHWQFSEFDFHCFLLNRLKQSCQPQSYSLFKTSCTGQPEESYLRKSLGEAGRKAYLPPWTYSEKKMLTSSWRRKLPEVLFSAAKWPAISPCS